MGNTHEFTWPRLTMLDKPIENYIHTQETF